MKIKSQSSCGMHPSVVTRVMSASCRGRWLDDLVPRMHNTEDLTAANDSLHLSQLITTEYGLFSFRASMPANLL